MRMTAVFATGLVAFLSGAQVSATDLPKEGSYDFMSCYSGTVNAIGFSKTHDASTSEYGGTIQSNPPGGLFDKVAFRCISLSYSEDGKTSTTIVCEGVDRDGHKYMTRIVGDGTNITRKVVAGTGKYEGMTASGTVEAMGPFGVSKPGTVQNCNHQKGSYRLK
ncbi:hypothetical protein [Roseateles saccharophilus]|uniref:DUF3617 family protein n=1 Tax=Roseateles saccharophilus TaxID=304 RepID=A0A4V2VNT9_ROSSA|nr:hypothetical protein [Roseateles saccharophilus]MDG0835620.1 hypothetical protein [Roseateles saccharophilus]TCU85127.1 hypothetical protein EV671_105017 [Roseateles saccharophilus]